MSMTTAEMVQEMRADSLRRAVLSLESAQKDLQSALNALERGKLDVVDAAVESVQHHTDFASARCALVRGMAAK